MKHQSVRENRTILKRKRCSVRRKSIGILKRLERKYPSFLDKNNVNPVVQDALSSNPTVSLTCCVKIFLSIFRFIEGLMIILRMFNCQEKSLPFNGYLHKNVK